MIDRASLKLSVLLVNMRFLFTLIFGVTKEGRYPVG